MSDITSAIGMMFSFLMENKLLGIPLLVWAILTALFTLLGSFIKGKKE